MKGFGSQMPTFRETLDKTGGIGPGFDILRLGLSIAILAAHCSGFMGNHGLLSSSIQGLLHFGSSDHATTAAQAIASVPATGPGIEESVSGPGRPITLSRVPMFFALSGFLVAGSAFRAKKVLPFLALRFFRIFPALLVEVSLSAILLGGLFTSLPLQQYYQSAGFFQYFGNIVGIVQLGIPSVEFPFSHKDMFNLNANLWTLPAELHSYAIMAVLMAIGLINRRIVLTVLVVIYTLVMIVANGWFGVQAGAGPLPAEVSVYYFICGLLFFLWREFIPYNWILFIISIVCAYLMMLSTHLVYVYPVFLVYLTLFIGLTKWFDSKLLSSGDYSYGYYLYGYPISQALLTTVPAFRGNLILFLPSAIFVTGLFSFLSWHLIEKRFLRLRKLFSLDSAKIASKLHPTALPITDDGAVTEDASEQGLARPSLK